jgi:hypothetical protein
MVAASMQCQRYIYIYYIIQKYAISPDLYIYIQKYAISPDLYIYIQKYAISPDLYIYIQKYAISPDLYIYNTCALSRHIGNMCMRLRNAGKGEASPSLFPRFAPNTHIYLYASTVHMYCIYPAILNRK